MVWSRFPSAKSCFVRASLPGLIEDVWVCYATQPYRIDLPSDADARIGISQRPR
jgi:hypothetical protein|tara:strand:+ start:10500 stop:10661 length:162 start_codon:yes stop_codon:yes gene_type:complete